VQKYPVRPTHRRNLDGAALLEIARLHFDEASADGSAVTARWGAIDRLRVSADGKELAVDLTMNPKVENAVASETIARYNRFLEEATGYTAKERAKRLRKSATSGADGD
jgi:hypothetical protein